MPKTERIEFEDTGDWWEFQTYLTVRQEREWVKHAVDATATFHDDSPELLNQLARNMDRLVVEATVGWSYGDVSLDTFYEIPSHHYAEVAERLGDLYSPLIRKTIERGQQIYTSLSSQMESAQSPMNS